MSFLGGGVFFKLQFDEEFLETKEQLQKLQDGECGQEATLGNPGTFF